MQPLVDAVADRLSTWKSKLISHIGRSTLAKVTLTAIPIHSIMVINVAPWIIRAIQKICMGFIWNGTESASGGQCLVSWRKIARPVELGSLGILDYFGLCLEATLGMAGSDEPQQNMDRPPWKNRSHCQGDVLNLHTS